MTSPLKLFDPQIERMLVAALIAEPGRLLGELENFAVGDLTDFHAVAAFKAVRNVEARSLPITAATIRAELSAELLAVDPGRALNEHPQLGDLKWFDDLVAIHLPPDPPIYSWATQILDLKAGAAAAIAEAEPLRRRTPRGPRADNTEPVRLGEAFMRYAYTRDGEPTLVRWARAWWRYDGTRYVEHDDEALDRDVIRFLDIAVAPQGEKDPITGKIKMYLSRVVATTKHINDTRKALIGVAPAISASAPHWISPADGDPAVDRLVACSNGILDLDTLQLLSHTPRLFTTTAIGAAWVPDAPQPTAWLAFLHSLWGEDTESIQLLQQIFGYFLTADTAQQKLFAIIGPKRSGKGTIARILKALLGDEAVVNPTLASLEQPFGLAPLVGKLLAIIGDARLGGQQDQAQVVERLLSISGEDRLSINRKNRDAIDVRLVVRVLLLSNELPRLYDTSGALASRFAILSMTRSFLGDEDIGLERKLLVELPGIFRWAIEGRQDLAERGRFIQPLASEAAMRNLREVSSPVALFVEECCVLDTEREVNRDTLYERYVEWCRASGSKPRDRTWLGRDLHTLHPELGEGHERRPDGKRIRIYRGIGLS
jgi:putative DNA primase/helicase